MADSQQLNLNEKRDFGECISDGFKFIGINYKAIFSGFLYYVLPIVLILGALAYFFGKSFFAAIMENTGELGSPFFIISLYAGLFLGFIMLYAVVFAVLEAYYDNDNQKVQYEDAHPYILPFFVQVIGIFLINVAIVIISMAIVMGLGFISPIFFVLLFAWGIAAIYVSIPMYLAVFIKVHERTDIMTAYKRAFYLVKDNWWPTFGVYFVASLIASMASYLVVMPLYIMMISEMISSVDTGEMAASTGKWAAATFLVYILASLLLSSYTIVCSVLKYYDLVEKKDATGLLNKIDQVGQNKDSMFENEGDF